MSALLYGGGRFKLPWSEDEHLEPSFATWSDI